MPVQFCPSENYHTITGIIFVICSVGYWGGGVPYINVCPWVLIVLAMPIAADSCSSIITFLKMISPLLSHQNHLVHYPCLMKGGRLCSETDNAPCIPITLIRFHATLINSKGKTMSSAHELSSKYRSMFSTTSTKVKT